MSSGVGVFTPKGRCNPFWMEFLKCKNTHPDPKVQCQDYIEDYLECLHHKKEVTVFFEIAIDSLSE
jgi:NADH dehydrogenase (ubiquinone) Fe-S protein 5